MPMIHSPFLSGLGRLYRWFTGAVLGWNPLMRQSLRTWTHLATQSRWLNRSFLVIRKEQCSVVTYFCIQNSTVVEFLFGSSKIFSMINQGSLLNCIYLFSTFCSALWILMCTLKFHLRQLTNHWAWFEFKIFLLNELYVRFII